MGKEMEKELSLVKKDADLFEAVAQEMSINNDEDMQHATKIGADVKFVAKAIQIKKESFTKPLNESLKNIREFFSPVEKQLAWAETLIKEKMNNYLKTQREEAEKKIKALEARVEKGTMKLSTAASKMAELEPTKTVKTERGSMNVRVTRDIEVYDEMAIPREYLIIDYVKLRKDALGGKEIAGVKVIEKSGIVFNK